METSEVCGPATGERNPAVPPTWNLHAWAACLQSSDPAARGAGCQWSPSDAPDRPMARREHWRLLDQDYAYGPCVIRRGERLVRVIDDPGREAGRMRARPLRLPRPRFGDAPTWRDWGDMPLDDDDDIGVRWAYFTERQEPAARKAFLLTAAAVFATVFEFERGHLIFEARLVLSRDRERSRVRRCAFIGLAWIDAQLPADLPIILPPDLAAGPPLSFSAPWAPA